MRNITYDTITEAVIASIDGTTDPRLKEILCAFIRKTHEWVKEVGLSHEEWEAAMNFLLRTGAISDEKRNEFVLLSDLIGVSSLVDMIASNAEPGASERSVLGPFYVPNAPFLEIGGDLAKDNEGDRVIFQGYVRSTSGAPIAGAVLDVWRTPPTVSTPTSIRARTTITCAAVCGRTRTGSIVSPRSGQSPTRCQMTAPAASSCGRPGAIAGGRPTCTCA